MPEVVNEDAPDGENIVVKFKTDGGVVSDAPPPEAPPETPSQAKPAPPTKSSDGIEQLEKQLAAANRQRDQIAQQARQVAAQRDQAIAYAQEAERRGISANEVFAEQRIASVQQEMDSLGTQQQSAYDSGDYKEVTRINLRLAKLGGDMSLFERDKQQFIWQREQAVAQQQQRAELQRRQAEQASRPTSAIEAATAGKTEKTAAFIRKHADRVVRADGTINSVVMRAHEEALDRRLVPDSDAYFEHIERALGGEKPAAREAPRSRAQSTAAPVSRPTVSGIPNFDGENLVMTDRMRKMAEEQLQPKNEAERIKAYKEWGASYVKAVREGRMEPIRE
jgi:hypothetical protein